MNKEVIIASIQKELSPGLPVQLQWEELEMYVTQKVSDLIEKDFQRLILILYRIDVSEQKLTQLLSENNGQDAADLISKLIIERQIQKAHSRKAFKNNSNQNSTEEKW